MQCRKIMHCLNPLLALERPCACYVLRWHGGRHIARYSPSAMPGQKFCSLLSRLYMKIWQVPKPTVEPAQDPQQQQSWSDKMKAGFAELKAEGTINAPTIVYSSRTHSQLAQVMKELRNTSYRWASRQSRRKYTCDIYQQFSDNADPDARC